MKKLHAVFAAIIASLLVQCATLDQKIVTNEAARKPMPGLKLEAGYDVYLLRVDLVRATHTETKTRTVSTTTNGVTTTRTETVLETVPNQYHCIVADFGNGIIMDYNHNLCLDIARLYGLSTAEGFKASVGEEGFFSAKAEIVKDGTSYKYSVGSKLFSSTVTGTIKPEEVTFESSGLFSGKSSIQVTKNSATLKASGFFGAESTIKKTSDTSLEFPGFWTKPTFKLIGDRKVDLSDGAFVIENRGNRIDFTYTGIFGITKHYTMIQVANSTYFFDDEFRGCEIRRDGQNILYFVNGDKRATLNIVKTK